VTAVVDAALQYQTSGDAKQTILQRIFPQTENKTKNIVQLSLLYFSGAQIDLAVKCMLKVA